MRVAQIGPGKLSIPPPGWGSIERVIWNIHQHSRNVGCNVREWIPDWLRRRVSAGG